MSLGFFVVDESQCIQCDECMNVCPVDAIYEGDNESAEIDADACLGCGACADACPMGAIAEGA